MNLRDFFTKPPVLENEYAKAVLEQKISLSEVFQTIWLFVIPFIVYLRNFIKLLENTRFELKPRKFRRIPPAMRWGHLPKRYF